MNRTIVVAALAAPALAACYPMEQAPLVYASKATIGVGVQAGTADNPGLELILGYKATDVALVPVAVAKFCRSQASADCQNQIYAMQVINGKKADQSIGSALRLSLSAAEVEKQRAFNRVQELRGEQQVLLAMQTKAIARDAATEALKALPAASTDEDAAIVTQRTKLQTELATLSQPALPLAKDLASRIATKESEITTATLAVDSAENNIKSLNARLSNDVSGNRDDSLSVYGTFAGGGQGDAEKASLTGDKVFATGIAAQNLTEYKGVIDCLNGIKKLADDIKDATAKDSYIAGTSSMCVKK